MNVKLIVNGENVTKDVPASRRLIDFLRDDLGLTGTKESCGVGECGSCTVLVNGEARLSCLTLLSQVQGCKITTIEGVEEEESLHPVQQAFVDTGAVQCGYCIPGFIMVSLELLQENPDPSREEIRRWLEGNLCRCTGYVKIVDAVELAAEKLRNS